MSSPRSRDRRTRERLLALLALWAGCTGFPCVAAAADDTQVIAQADEPAAEGDADAARETQAEPSDTATPPETTPAEPAEEPRGDGADLPLPEGVEVIHVRSEAYQEIAAEVATSVTQFDAEALKALGAQNVADLAKVTPNLEIKTAGATAPTFFIRGVGLSDFASNAAGAISVYQDDVPRNAPAIQLGQLFDTENVQVLRGPQGGGSGRNASGGAIKIYSRKPTGELGGFLRASLGNFGFQDYEGAIESPLVEDMLSSRLAFRLTERDGTMENRCARVPRPELLNPGSPAAAFSGRPTPPLSDRVADPTTWNRVKFCGETTFASFKHPDPIDPPPDQPPVVSILGPFGMGRQLSPIPGGLPREVNDIGNWATRGQVRLQPPDTDMDWLFNVHGSHLNQLSTLGQAVGTQVVPGIPGFMTSPDEYFGGHVATNAAYRDPDIVQIENRLIAKGLTGEALEDAVGREIARNLDGDPFAGDFNRVGDTTLDTWGGFARGDWLLGDVELTTITGYDAYTRNRDQDQDFSPEILFEGIQDDEAWQFTQELKAAGELPDTPVRWNAGGFYLLERLDSSTWQLARNPNAFNLPNELLLDYSQNLWSWGGFAGFAWDFLDDFTLDGGFRYNWEKKNFDYKLRVFQVDSLVEEDATWQAPTGTLKLIYRFREDTSVWWKYSRGWKGGHFNALPQTTLGATQADPETIDAFEMGMEGSWIDGRLGVKAQTFYYKYQDYQVLVVQDSAAGPPGIAIINANDAEVYGAELEARVEPLDGLVVTGNLGWLESQFLDFTNDVVRTVIGTDGQPTPRIVTVDYTGNQLINSPNLKASAAVEYTIDLGRYGAILPRYDFAWTDDIFFDPTEGRGSPNFSGTLVLPEYGTGQRAYTIHNARIAFRTADGNLEVAGWVRNFLNQEYKQYAFDATGFSKVVINYIGEPRTYGGEISINF